MRSIDDDLTALGFERTPSILDQGVPDETEPEPHRRARHILLVLVGTLVALVLAIASILLVGVAVAPEKTKEVVGETATTITHAARQATGVEPKVILGPVGDQADIDSCPGYWVHMASYNEGTGFEVPVYSAHNGCFGLGDRGDVILPLKIGETIQIEDRHGATRSHTVVDVRTLPQRTTTTDALKGMTGPLILQTCYWDDSTMKFISVKPVG